MSLVFVVCCLMVVVCWLSLSLPAVRCAVFDAVSCGVCCRLLLAVCWRVVFVVW